MPMMNNFNKPNPIYGVNLVDGWMGASYLHEFVVAQINKIKSSGIQYPPSMEERWQVVHAEYVDKAAWVKQMLAL